LARRWCLARARLARRRVAWRWLARPRLARRRMARRLAWDGCLEWRLGRWRRRLVGHRPASPISLLRRLLRREFLRRVQPRLLPGRILSLVARRLVRRALSVVSRFRQHVPAFQWTASSVRIALSGRTEIMGKGAATRRPFF